MQFKPTIFMQMASTGLVLTLVSHSVPLNAQDTAPKQPIKMIRPQPFASSFEQIGKKIEKIEKELEQLEQAQFSGSNKPDSLPTEGRPPHFVQEQLPSGLHPARPHRGKYFLFSGSYLAFTSERSLALGSAKAQLETKTGRGLSVAIGRQNENWTLGAEFGYFRQGYETFNLPTAFSEIATGNSRNYSFSLFVGRDFQLNRSWRIHAGATLGVSLRHEAIGSPTLRALFSPNYNDFLIRDEGACFQGSAGIRLDYAFSDLCSTYLGYRFTYVNELGDFDILPINMVELGLRWNL
jgi:hypothetical protein